jgi:hypothetical protein
MPGSARLVTAISPKTFVSNCARMPSSSPPRWLQDSRSRIVDEDVDPPEAGFRLADRSVNGGIVCDIEAKSHSAIAMVLHEVGQHFRRAGG